MLLWNMTFDWNKNTEKDLKTEKMSYSKKYKVQIKNSRVGSKYTAYSFKNTWGIR